MADPFTNNIQIMNQTQEIRRLLSMLLRRFKDKKLRNLQIKQQQKEHKEGEIQLNT